MRSFPRKRPLNFYVQETLYAADPYYRGPHQSRIVTPEEPIHEIDPRKAAADLGRIEPDADGVPRYTNPEWEYDMASIGPSERPQKL